MPRSSQSSFLRRVMCRVFTCAAVYLIMPLSLVAASSAEQQERERAQPVHPPKPVVMSATGNGKCGAPTPTCEHDAVHLRDGQVISGKLLFLEGFATVQQGASKRNFARDKVGSALICGKELPRQSAPVPNDNDSVILDGGKVVVGHVNVDPAGIHVNSQTFERNDVALIHLKLPGKTQPPDEGEENPSAAQNAVSPQQNSTSGSAGSGEPSTGKGPAEIPWGKALWRGEFHSKQTAHCAKTAQSTFTSPKLSDEDTFYYTTWSEEVVNTGMVRLHLVSLTYRYSGTFLDCRKECNCKESGVSKQGSAVDQVYPDLPSRVLVTLKAPGTHAGDYLVNILPPTQFPDPVTSHSYNLPSFLISSGLYTGYGTVQGRETPRDCDRIVPVFPASAPYTAITGKRTCGPTGPTENTVEFQWRLMRGAP